TWKPAERYSRPRRSVTGPSARPAVRPTDMDRLNLTLPDSPSTPTSVKWTRAMEGVSDQLGGAGGAWAAAGAAASRRMAGRSAPGRSALMWVGLPGCRVTGILHR